MQRETNGMQDEEEMDNDDFNLVKVSFLKEDSKMDKKQVSTIITQVTKGLKPRYIDMF